MTETTHTYWISIGRNVGADPLPIVTWGEFVAEVHATLEHHGAYIVTTVAGRSAWGDVPEDTALWLVAIGADAAAWLRDGLRYCAKNYHQEAIGFVGGPGKSLIYAN